MVAILNRKRAAAGTGMDAVHQGSATCGSGKKKRRIGNVYEEESRLGDGAYGVVVKARHLVTGKIVAIKCLHPDKSSSDAGVSDDSSSTDAGDLVREASFLRACGRNPYLVGFEDLTRDPSTGDLCLVMQYVGPSLQDLLRDRPPLREATVRSIMLQLLIGAKHMQERQIIHRDIKPANVLVEEDGRLVKICDLGLAMSTSDPMPYTQAGTTSYMAPEILLGKPDYSAVVDSWSLGCVMAELLTSKKLFKTSHKSNETRQLRTIFRVLGVPNATTWPGFASLPDANDVLDLLQKTKKKKLMKGSGLRQLFPAETLSENGFEVLQGLLTCNPDDRLTAAAALRLPWFSPPHDDEAEPLELPRKEVDMAAPPKKKLLIKITLTPPLKLRIKFTPPATPKKNVLRIPLQIWKKHHGPTCSCNLCTGG